MLDNIFFKKSISSTSGTRAATGAHGGAWVRTTHG
jgi:hypothetical protein